MAVAPTGAIYKALKFDNVSSRTYGVYITGEAVYNAPERDVEMITIPGRSGSFALDNGRFENIEVSYPAGIYADTEADFRQAISDFRNFLCSRNGYVRLQDEYNPDEYRMAVYKSGLEVTPAMLKAGEFNIVFDCKPQRWLTSGETKVTIANSGDTLTNPTLFDARPMVETTGYGTLTVNGHEVELENRPLGDVTVLASKKKTSSTVTVVGEWTIDKSQILSGDTLTMDSQKVSSYEGSAYGFASFNINAPNADRITIDSYTQTNLEYINGSPSLSRASLTGLLSPATFTEGTASSVSGSGSASINIYEGLTLMETATVSFAITLAYDGDDKITATLTESIVTDAQGYLSNDRVSVTTSKVVGFSTISALGNPTYIDCDLGACYMIENDEIIDLNGYIDLGSDLPTLGVGENEITFDNTFTEVDVIPRWWKV